MGLLSGLKRIKNEFAEANDILKMSSEMLLELDDMALRELVEKCNEADGSKMVVINKIMIETSH